jgi:type III secretion protein U
MSNDQGGSKTELPTPKRLRDAKEKGNVLQSKEIVSAAGLISTFIFFYVASDWFLKTNLDLLLFTAKYFSLPFEKSLEDVIVGNLMIAMPVTLAFVGMSMLVSICSSIAQTGGTFAPDKLKINPDTLNPINGAKNLFSKKSLTGVLESLIKTIIYALIFTHLIVKHIKDIIYTHHCGVDCILQITFEILKEFAIYMAIVSLTIAVIDYIIQRKIYMSDLMMSKDEIKREHKDVEGNPEIKRRRREIHREIIESGTERVAASDVIVTNPTHLAIGIMFRKGKTPLPIVTLKECDQNALIIRQLAKEQGKPIVENVPLARALWESGEIERYVPGDLLEPVAQVLAWVEQMKNH